MREIPVAELAESVDDPFVRHQVDPLLVRRAWVSGDAAALQARGHLPGATGDIVTLVGPGEQLRALAAYVAAAVPQPWRVTVPEGATDALPAAWRHSEHRLWHWMLTDSAPPAAGADVVEVTDADEVNALLDLGAPTAHARPGSPRVECWLGVREAGVLVAVGALVRQADGTGHLRAVTVLPVARGRGLGRDVSAALTLRALDGGSGVATLGVYVDNEPAVAMYRGLGYDVVHTFASGPVGPVSG